jgi:hypothetical protein
MKTSGFVKASSASRNPGLSFQNPHATSPKSPESRNRSVNSRVGELDVQLTLDPCASTNSAASVFGANGAFIPEVEAASPPLNHQKSVDDFASTLFPFGSRIETPASS